MVFGAGIQADALVSRGETRSASPGQLSRRNQTLPCKRGMVTLVRRLWFRFPGFKRVKFSWLLPARSVPTRFQFNKFFRPFTDDLTASTLQRFPFLFHQETLANLSQDQFEIGPASNHYTIKTCFTSIFE
jgi:hypothetical protein